MAKRREKASDSLAAYVHDLPRPLNVLVHHMKANAPIAFVAMCLQYSIEGKGNTPEVAVENALRNLAHYLSVCAKHHAAAFSAAHDQYQQAFYRADPMELDDLHSTDIHVRVRLVDHNPPARQIADEEDEQVIEVDVREAVLT